MLKVYAVENLRSGLVVGRDIMDEGGNVLISMGTALTKEMIYGLLDRPIFSVYIEEKEPAAEIEGQEHLLDDEYLSCYNDAYAKLEKMFQDLAEKGQFDAAELQNLMDEKTLWS